MTSNSKVNPYSYPGACGQDGRCLTCGKVAHPTAGCLECRNSYYLVPAIPTVTEHTVYAYTNTSEQPLVMDCSHGGIVGQPCPHCIGVGSFG